MLPLLVPCLLVAARVAAEITVYTTEYTGTGIPPSPSATATCISASACDNITLTPIALPQPGQSTNNIPIQLLTGGMPGMGHIVNGDFQGFSIELSIANSILGNDGNIVNPIFLNLMSNIVARAGRVLCRVGGNSQETAAVVPVLPNNTAIEKINKTAFTPTLLLSPNLIYAMGNISSLLNVDWFIGLPFNDSANIRPELAELSQKFLGSHLLGMQLGNEPDLFAQNGLRNNTYQPQNYADEFGQSIALYQQDPNVPNTNMFVGPSVCCGGPPGSGQPGWIPEQVWDTGFLSSYANNLAYVSVEHYPTNNCPGTSFDPNVILPQLFLNHSAVSALSAPYINSSQIVQGFGKPFIMFETNTASCGGFHSLSDSFAAGLWAVDYNLNMAVNNFSNALYHLGGQNAFYNPFTPPPTNQTKFRQWTIGPTYYSALVTAEALGRNNKSQVVDLGLNSNNDNTPGYAIIEDGVPQRVVLLNFYTDPTGANNYTAWISVGGNQTGQTAATPSSVTVKYFVAPSVSEKWAITWAGQTFGGPFGSDGRPQGTLQQYTYDCDTTNNVCPVPVPAPGVAVVFLNSDALQAGEPTTTQTFATTAATGSSRNTATIDPSVLAVSNGRGGQSFLGLGSTSPGTSSSGTVGLRASLGMIGVSMISAVLFSARTVVWQ